MVDPLTASVTTTATATATTGARPSPALQQAVAGAAVWGVAWLVMALLDGRLGLANLALVAVLAAAVVALWWPLAWSLAGSAAAVLAFNVAFVPPRGSFSVDLHQHALLLLTLLTVSWIVALLMARLRSLAAREQQHHQRVQQLHALAGLLRDADDPRAAATALQQALSALCGAPAVLMLLHDALPRLDDPRAELWCGQASSEQRAGLWLCLRQNRAMGPGTGWHDEQPAWYLPLRGRTASLGAALLPLHHLAATAAHRAELRQQAQSLCDQMGQALQRAAALRAASAAHEEAQTQRLHNTLLAAISHDYRTPLATILGAASSLHDQGDRLSPAQRQRLAARIVDETEQLRRLTDNTLQLARLDAPGLQLATDWESVEEMVGTVLRRLRQRDPTLRVKARLDPALPLVRCDAVLMVQLLDNLVDNALKYGGGPDGAPAQLEIRARALPGQWLLAVRDRGPGVPLESRQRVFAAYARGEQAGGTNATFDPAAQRRPGSGVGLALCRAIARAHGGELTLRARSHGGSSFECHLPLSEPPAGAPGADPAPAPASTPVAPPTSGAASASETTNAASP